MSNRNSNSSTMVRYTGNQPTIDPEDIDNPIDREAINDKQVQHETDPNEEPRRQYKYSTAYMPKRRRWRKFCCIGLLFLIGMAITTGISMLIQQLFFKNKNNSNTSTNDFPDRNPNETQFVDNKDVVDQACSGGTMDYDGGRRCRDVCNPQFFTCCDPFAEFVNYNQALAAVQAEQAAAAAALQKNMTSNSTTTTLTNSSSSSATSSTTSTFGATSSLNGTTNTTSAVPSNFPSSSPSFMPSLAPTQFIFSNATNTTNVDNQTCAFEQDVRGCVSYAKCQVLAGLTDAAPSTLATLCSMDQLKKDPTSCQQLCLSDAVRCCFASENNCMATNFDVCLDFAPCQNLRQLKTPLTTFVLETAPPDLDQACLWQLPECFDSCEKAKCCGDVEASCLQTNFMSCLTYAACTNVTDTDIALKPIFNTLPPPTPNVTTTCHPDTHNSQQQVHISYVGSPDPPTCSDLCETAKCCYAQDRSQNCFFDDPLGCVAWNQNCQVLFYGASSSSGNTNDDMVGGGSSGSSSTGGDSVTGTSASYDAAYQQGLNGN